MTKHTKTKRKQTKPRTPVAANPASLRAIHLDTLPAIAGGGLPPTAIVVGVVC
jgi:hypothetical protein